MTIIKMILFKIQEIKHIPMNINPQTYDQNINPSMPLKI